MEIALFINNKLKIANDINSINFSSNNECKKRVNEGLKSVVGWLNSKGYNSVNRIYYGSEFCEKVLPTPNQVLEVAMTCQDKGLGFTYVTSPLTDYGMEICKKTIEMLENSGIPYEVVFNDIGLLFWYKINIGGSTILGRLFDKTSHDGRVCGDKLIGFYGKNTKDYSVNSNIFSNASKELFDKFNVCRIELDLPNLPLNIDNIDSDLSIYLPFSFLTTGRRCMIGMVNNESSVEKCSKLCKKYTQLMTKPLNTLNKKKNTMLRKGNTIYYLPEEFSLSIECYNRVILELQI